MATRRDGAGDDALSLAIARHRRAQLLDDSYRIMADRQAFSDRVLALQDVNVGSANRRRGDSQQGVERTDFGNGLLVQNDAARLDEYRGSHFRHLSSLHSDSAEA